MAEDIRKYPAQARGLDNLIKLASLIDQFDRTAGLVKLYGDGGLARPEEVLFSVNEKCASQFVTAHVETTTGNTYAISRTTSCQNCCQSSPDQCPYNTTHNFISSLISTYFVFARKG